MANEGCNSNKKVMDSEEDMELTQIKTQNETLAKSLDLKNVEIEDLKQCLARSKTRYQCGMLLLGIVLIVQVSFFLSAVFAL